MSVDKFLLVLFSLCLTSIGMAQQGNIPSDSIHLQLYDTQSSSRIGKNAGIRVLSPIGTKISRTDTDSQEWLIVDIDPELAVEVVAFAEGYRSDTFLLPPGIGHERLSLAPISDGGGTIDNQPVLSKQRQTTRQAPDEMTAFEWMVLPEKRGGGMPRLQRVPTKLTGFTILIRENQGPMQKGDSLLQEFGKIMWKQQSDKSYNFYTGSFASLDEARTFLEEKVINDVPKARIIEFISGRVHSEVRSNQ